ncbi:hypothetical protein Fmac_015869 [Flemingia macrophylla]|uniref:Uncharacterized protein n=1 Tax=Flemingia macrophylla TaxID=520843 RepID=A0ABD1MFU8_9FABA
MCRARSSPSVSTPTSARHIGHVVCVASHGLMHTTWNTWPHLGSKCNISVWTNSVRHTMHDNVTFCCVVE